MITVTKGQWFPLTIGNISYGGAAFDLQGATEVSASLVSTLGVRSPLSFEITAYNELSAVSDGSLSAGKYAIEVSCKGADGKSYRMKSPGAIIEVSASTTPSVGSTSVRVTGDEWELTADVEMHEGQARTYMSLLEEARKKAVKATEEATEAASAVNAAKTACEEQTVKAEKTNDDITAAETARVTAENGRVKAENERAQSEQSRESAEAERASAEKARADAETERAAAETQRIDAETQRETAFSSAKEACEAATSNATAAADKANTATTNANGATEAATEAETERQDAEDARKEAETARVEAESSRASAEQARGATESERLKAEVERQGNERARKDAEQTRAEAEERREAFFNTTAQPAIEEAGKVNAELDGTKISVTNRKGETKSLELVDIDEHVTVTIKSDVEGLSVSSISVTVYRNHGEVPESYTTDADGKVTFSVTRGTYYEVHFPEKTGAQLISPMGYTATLPVRNIEATYLSDGDGAFEAVTIETKKVNADNSKEAFPNVNITVQIGSGEAQTLTTDAEGKATFNVPVGKSYKIVFSEQSGYFLFFERSYTRELVADSITREIDFFYSAYKTGVYIVTQDGKEYTLESFKAKAVDVSEAKMVAVYERNLMLNGGVIYASIDELSKPSFPQLQWCNQNVLFNDIPSDGSKTDSQCYYDGNGATKAIVKEATERGLLVPAATYVQGKTVAIGGKTMTGYLPSVGQMVILQNNATAVDEILKYVTGGTAKSKSGYSGFYKWAAAQSGSTNAWIFTSGTSSYIKTGNSCVACFYAY